MDAITDIFDALGGPTAIAKATGDPVQTVHDWWTKRRIPKWRRQPLVDLASREGTTLSPAAQTYLASLARDPGAVIAAPEQAAA